MGKRFHIAVFNYNDIDSFINNYHKIINFKPDEDLILFFDSSTKENEFDKLYNFIKSQKLIINYNIKIIKRENWGRDQGARIEYFTMLLNSTEDMPKYVWHFQMHYLDTTSSSSIFPNGTKNINGQDLSNTVKQDVIPDNSVIDLNECEYIYNSNKNISTLFLSRKNIGVFTLSYFKRWYYVDGVNFCFRLEILEKCLSINRLRNYKKLYDNTYNWTLYMEFEWGRLFTKTGNWYDLKNKRIFVNNIGDSFEIDNQGFFQKNEQEYVTIYKKYRNKFIHSILNYLNLWQ